MHKIRTGYVRDERTSRIYQRHGSIMRTAHGGRQDKPCTSYTYHTYIPSYIDKYPVCCHCHCHPHPFWTRVLHLFCSSIRWPHSISKARSSFAWAHRTIKKSKQTQVHSSTKARKPSKQPKQKRHLLVSICIYTAVGVTLT